MSKREQQERTSAWRKSSFSMANGACVEAAADPGTVLVRDSASRTDSELRFAAGAWQDFVERIKSA